MRGHGWQRGDAASRINFATVVSGACCLDETARRGARTPPITSRLFGEHNVCVCRASNQTHTQGEDAGGIFVIIVLALQGRCKGVLRSPGSHGQACSPNAVQSSKIMEIMLCPGGSPVMSQAMHHDSKIHCSLEFYLPQRDQQDSISKRPP